MAGRTPAPPPEDGQELVERQHELAAVTDALTALADGRGGAILVEGEAGLGKTRLLAEAAHLARAGPAQVLQARAGRRDRDLPAAVLTRLLSPHLAANRDRAQDWFAGAARLARPLLYGEAPSGTAGTPSLQSGLHGLYWLLLNMAAASPIVIIVDDLQWCDDTTTALLLYLADRLDATPVLLVAAARPRRRGADGEPLRALRATSGIRSLRLRPLSAAGVGRFLDQSGHRCDPAVSAACADVTAGNPFYLQELLISLQHRDEGIAAMTAAQVRQLGSEATAQAAVLRLARCDQTCVRLAESLAVLAGPAPLRIAADLAGVAPEAAARAADELAAEALLHSGPVLEFTHPLIREAVYGEIAPAARALAHLMAARLLRETGASASEVGAQLLLAPATGDGAVVAALLAAAAAADSLGAPASAARLLHRALAEGAPGIDPAPVLIDLAAAENAAGMPGAAEHARSALELATDPRMRSTAYRVLARALADDNRHEEAATELERRLDELETTGDGDGAALLRDYLAYAAFLPGLRQRSHARAAAALATGPDASTTEGRQLLAVLSLRAAQSGEAVERTRALAADAWRGGQLLTETGVDDAAWLMVVWALHLSEDWSTAAGVCTAAMAAAARTGSMQAFVTASFFRAWAYRALGELDPATADNDQAIDGCSELSHRYLVPALVQRANLLLDRGEPDAAARALSDADALPGTGMLEVPWRLHAHGRLALARHDAQGALESFERAGSYLSGDLDAQVTVLPWRSDGATAALLAGRPDRACELAHRDLEIADAVGLTASRGRALRVLGLASGGDEGLRLLAEAVGTLEATPASLETAAARADLGAALRRAGRLREARDPLTAALETADRRGAHALADRIRRDLEAAGFRAPAAQRPDGEQLTAGQRRVADLAARGMSNVEIAQELFVTPKTVEYHLSQVYQRLQIPGRRKLAATLAGLSAGDDARG